MHQAGAPRGGPSAEVEASPQSISVGDCGLASRWGIRAGGMAPGGCKVWLSWLGGGPQISWKSGRQARSKHIRTKNDNNIILVNDQYLSDLKSTFQIDKYCNNLILFFAFYLDNSRNICQKEN